MEETALTIRQIADHNLMTSKRDPHAPGIRTELSYKAREPVGSGSGDLGKSSVAEFDETSHP